MSFMSKLKSKKGKRSPQEIQQEYSQLCAQMGENSFRIEETEKMNRQLASRIRELGPEMQAAQERAKAEAEAKKAEAK